MGFITHNLIIKTLWCIGNQTNKMGEISQAPMDTETPRQRKIGKVYIGTKVIRAEPMSNEDWLRSQNKWQEGQETAGDGYKVQYEDGYFSWSPKQVFERCYREVTEQERRMTW